MRNFIFSVIIIIINCNKGFSYFIDDKLEKNMFSLKFPMSVMMTHRFVRSGLIIIIIIIIVGKIQPKLSYIISADIDFSKYSLNKCQNSNKHYMATIY